MNRFWMISLVVLAALAPAFQAVGGPPLLCHSVKIEEGQSLPWGSATDAFTEDEKYNTANVVGDALKFLNSETPVLVRMETLRRATIYIDKNQSKADALLGALMARALDAESAGTPDAYAWFDAGYAVQCFRQAGLRTSFGPAVTKGVVGSAVEGYSWVARAIKLKGGSPEMELAAALMTADTRVPEHAQHLKNVLSADFSKNESAKDLLTWIAQINGTTVEALRTKHGIADARAGR